MNIFGKDEIRLLPLCGAMDGIFDEISLLCCVP
jgi:hypothetical protein